jgi:hypothetical protein
MNDAIETMLSWLIGNCVIFGLNGQNWMLLVGGGLLLYIGALIAARHFQDRKRPTAH